MTKTEDESGGNQLSSSVNSDSKMEDKQSGDMCRVCRSEGTTDKPLYYPCVCTGSIKYIHQDCLVQWLRYSKKEYCELCKHRYTFTPIYAPDMPKRLPIKDIVTGLVRGMLRAVRYWVHYTLVAVAWLGIVPLTACRIYRCLFTGSINALLTLPLDMLATENMVTDCFQGCFIVTCTLCTFISLVWLREQILHGGGPDWLDRDIAAANNRQNPAPAAPDRAAAAAAAPAAGEGVAAAAADPPDPAAEAAAAADAEADSDDDGDDDDDDEEEDDEGNNVQGGVAADINNWNPIEWDRAAEELTWERLLGLDGSLLFLEHVFWVVSLNTLFILIFAFCPYHIGRLTVSSLDIVLTATQFEGALTTMAGYIVIGFALILLHFIGSMARLKTACRLFGLCYVAVKVSLLVIIEIGLFPLICGWWLDICSLNMFDATLKDREQNFRIAPGTSMFIHWLMGMVYIFYFASFILLLREVLRPGLLWFLRNMNDPDFNPIQEMIHLSVYRHVRRFIASMVVFGTIILVMLWLPIQLIRRLFPSFLPFHIMLSGDLPVSELSLELLLLQVILPTLLEQGHTRQWLRGLIRGWCVCTAWLLDLRSYLLGDEPQEGDNARTENQPQNADGEQNPPAAAADANLAAEADAAAVAAAAEIVAAATAAAVGAVAAETASVSPEATQQHSAASVLWSDKTRSYHDRVKTNLENSLDIESRLDQLSHTFVGALAKDYTVSNATASDDSRMSGSSVDAVTDEDYDIVTFINSGVESVNSLEVKDVLTGQKTLSKRCLEETSLSYVEQGACETSLASHDKNSLGVGGLVPEIISDPELKRRTDGMTAVLETEPECADFVKVSCDAQEISGGLHLGLDTNAQIVENSHVVADQIEVLPLQPEAPPLLPEAPPALPEAPSALPEALPAQPEVQPALPEAPPALPEALPAQPEAPPRPVEAPPAQNNILRAQAANRNANQRPVRPELAQIAPIINMALGDAHQAMLQVGGPLGFQPYQAPDMFALRLICLVLLMCATLFMASLMSFTLPVFVGRRLMSVWTGEGRIHELYTAACGLYMCWVALRISMVFYTWIPQGWQAISEKIFEWTLLVSKSVFIAVVLIGLVPLMLGVIFELVIVIPIRVPIEQSPMFFPWQDWALGVLHAKIITAATMMGPPWRLKRVIEQVYNQGLRQMDLKYIMTELCLPVLVCLGLVLAVPMILSKSIVPAFGFDAETQNLVHRRIYPCLLGIITFISFCIFQARQFRRLYEHIRNDKYLVGQRLVNYERKAAATS